MAEDTPAEAYLKLLEDPLSPVSRSARNKVMLFSSIALVIAFGGVTPKEPSFSGFKFPGLTEDFAHLAIGSLVLYTAAVFLIHLSVDREAFSHHQDRFRKAKALDYWKNYDTEPDDYNQMQADEFKSVTGYDIERIVKRSGRSITVRAIVDFHVPVVYALIALIALLVKWK